MPSEHGGLPDEKAARLLSKIGAELMQRYEQTGNLDALRQAVMVFRVALHLTPEGSPGYPALLKDLGIALLIFYDETEKSSVLQEAESVIRKALELLPPESPERVALLLALSGALTQLYASTQELKDFLNAESVIRKALELVPPESPEHVSLLVELGSLFRYRFEDVGDRNLILNSLIYLSEAVKTSRRGDSDPSVLSELALALLRFHEAFGGGHESVGVVTKATETLFEELASLPKESVYYRDILSELGTVLLALYEATGNSAVVESAAEILRQAVNETPEESASYPYLLSNYAIALLRLAGLNEDQRKTRQLIEKAIAVFSEAADKVTDLHPIYPSIIGGLGNAFYGLYEVAGDVDALKKAVASHRLAVSRVKETSQEYPDRIASLSVAMLSLFEEGGGGQDISGEVKAALRRAVEQGKIRKPRTAILVAARWFRHAFSRGEWNEIVEVYPHALSALRMLLLHHTNRRVPVSALAEFQPLPALAAYANVMRRKPKEGALALEEGRTFLLREALERARRDLGRLPNLGYGELYNSFKTAEERLRRLERTPDDARPPDWLTQLDAARRELQVAVEAIREKAGKAHPEYRFLLKPLPFEEIQRLAGGTPLVYLFATPREGGALIVHGKGGPSFVPLPGLSQDRLMEMLLGPENEREKGYLPAYRVWRSRNDPASRAAWYQAIEQALAFLGEGLAPLRKALDDAGYRRATLVPDGPLVLLPLHAARFADGTYFLEHLAFAYAPSAHALYHARLVAEEARADRLLAVEDPRGDLSFAHDEVAAVRAHFPGAIHLMGAEATRETVKRVLPKVGLFHFSGHGQGGWWGEEPVLTLADGDLPLSSLFEAAGSTRLRLAVLSACETGVPDPKALNEVLNLPVGFMLAGAAGALGSLWAVNDYSTAILIMRFYAELVGSAVDAAEALRRAQAWMLRTPPEGKARFRETIEETLSSTHVRMSSEVAERLKRADLSHPYYWAAFGYYGIPARLGDVG